jgi:hypothetical protein
MLQWFFRGVQSVVLKRFNDAAGTNIFINPEQVRMLHSTTPGYTMIDVGSSEKVTVEGDVDDVVMALLRE